MTIKKLQQLSQQKAQLFFKMETTTTTPLMMSLTAGDEIYKTEKGLYGNKCF